MWLLDFGLNYHFSLQDNMEQKEDEQTLLNSSDAQNEFSDAQNEFSDAQSEFSDNQIQPSFESQQESYEQASGQLNGGDNSLPSEGSSNYQR